MIADSTAATHSSLRILYVTPFLQHPSLQGPTRHYYFIRELSKHHEITLLTPIRSRDTDEALAEMAKYTQRIVSFDAQKATTRAPRLMGGVRSRLARLRQLRSVIYQMKEAFEQLVEQSEFDLVLFHGKSVFPVVEDFSELPMVVDFCDATSLRLLGRMRYSSPKTWPWLLMRYLQTRSLERKLIRMTPYQAFITSRDRDAILGGGGQGKIIPNVVDLDYWKSAPRNPDPNCIMYSGGMDYRPNVDGALFLMKKVLPILRQRRPDIQVLIVGRDPTTEIIDTASRFPDVTVTGSVADMRPYFERAAVYACPIRFASGQQNKLIEAMAMEVPVVCTSIAAQGMAFDDARKPPLIVADDAHSFASCLERVLDYPAETRQMAADGRTYVEDHFVSDHTISVLQQMCDGAVAG